MPAFSVGSAVPDTSGEAGTTAAFRSAALFAASRVPDLCVLVKRLIDHF